MTEEMAQRREHGVRGMQEGVWELDPAGGSESSITRSFSSE